MISTMLEHFLRPYALVAIFVVVAGLAYYHRQSHPRPHDDLPLLNTKEGECFTALRARMRSTFNYKEVIHQAYQQV